jgi:ABC-type transport system involved in multi-copper enzyme maturation permease subunit
MSTVWLLAASTFQEARRRKILLVFLFGALAIMLMGMAFGSLQPSRDLSVTKSLGLGVISLAGVFISIILYITLIPAEIERRTIYSILSKPVQRSQYVAGKFLGGLMTVLANIALMGVIFLVIMTAKQIGYQHSGDSALSAAQVDAALVKNLLMIFFQMTLLGAVAMFFSVFLPPVVNFFLTFGVWLLGSAPILKSGPLAFLHLILPNFGNFSIQNPFINPSQHVTQEPAYIGLNIVYALVYTAILLMLGTVIFDRREV